MTVHEAKWRRATWIFIVVVIVLLWLSRVYRPFPLSSSLGAKLDNFTPPPGFVFDERVIDDSPWCLFRCGDKVVTDVYVTDERPNLDSLCVTLGQQTYRWVDKQQDPRDADVENTYPCVFGASWPFDTRWSAHVEIHDGAEGFQKDERLYIKVSLSSPK